MEVEQVSNLFIPAPLSRPAIDRRLSYVLASPSCFDSSFLRSFAAIHSPLCPSQLFSTSTVSSAMTPM
jgi:hypothetical protein